MSTGTSNLSSVPSLSLTGRMLVLVVAFLGWLCAGMHFSITPLAGRDVAIDLLNRTGKLDAARFQSLSKQAQTKGAPDPSRPALSAADKLQLEKWRALVAQWFAWYQCAFLFGAASGGLLFGWLGDRIGRAKGMAASILTYSALDGAVYFSESPAAFLVLWYLASLGVGGMWPNGVALVGEAWSGMSRPMVAGLLGTSANIGIFLMNTIALQEGYKVTPDHWRWVTLISAAPLVLGLFSLIAVPESPRWLAARNDQTTGKPAQVSVGEVFRPPLLKITLVGIALATIPLFGGWGSANWMVPWAGEVGEAANPPNPSLKASVGQARALTGIVGSLLGGWVASVVGRRLSYFLVSLLALGIAQYTFWYLIPTSPGFMAWVAALGFFSGIYFGWLPLFLPELFATRVRSTGAGVSFNFGRILTAVTIFATGLLMDVFGGDYARIGRVTSLIYVLGMLVVWFTPDTSQKQLDD